ncbi:MAG: hypothetical protein EHM61_05545 [Acidobacteria bacterium]|nr:MAG: hypothetical protein EHM61_05545 [Acidobacteriota bacterium]
MMTFILLWSLVSLAFPHESELKETVSAYWNLMAKGEKASALKFVVESCQNDFINRVEPKIQTWRYVSADSVSETEATVTIEMEALFRGAQIASGFQKITKRETWVRDGNSWKLRVTKPSMESLGPLVSGPQKAALPKGLRVTPTVLKIQFLNKSQTGRLRIENGNDLAAQVVSAKFDKTRFELVKWPDRIEPGEVAEIVVRYKGTENDKNLESQLNLVLKEGDQEAKLFQVPVIYNYLSDGARGLFGLTEEQAQKLKRGDKVTPVLKVPPKSPEAGTPPPAEK